MKLFKSMLLSASLLTASWTVAQIPSPAPRSTLPIPSAAAPSSAEGQIDTVRVLTKSDADAWLEGFLPYALHSSDIPGAVVVVVKDGKILTARGFGYANVANRTPVDPYKTLFRVGSVSKLVTWTAVMQLVEQKKLDLDEDVNKYLDFKIPARAGAPVTLRQIMTHTAGFEEAGKNIIAFDRQQVPAYGALLKAWVPHRIYDAGTTPAYSNYATSLAGYIVERVSGVPFDDYVESAIFTPLQMRGASMRQPLPTGLAGHMATGYAKQGEESPGFEIVGPAPAGSMSASGEDMARFMIAHLQNGELDGRRILSAETANTMHDSPLNKIHPRSLIGSLNRMELGFFETNVNGRDVIAHLGDTEAFHTSLHLFRKESVGLYVSFNSSGKAGASGTLRGALFHDFADRYYPGVAAANPKTDPKLAAEHAQLMVGNWHSSRRSETSFFSILGLFGQVKIVVGPKGELVVPALVGRNGRPREWAEIAPFVWQDKDGHDRLAGVVVDGQVVRWSMDFMSPFMVFDRVPVGKSGSWIRPVLYASIAVLLLTLLAGPAGWIARKKYGVTLASTAAARRASMAVKAVAGLVLLVLAGWVGVFAAMLQSLKYATSIMDPWLWILQIVGVIVFVAAIAVSARHAWLTWTDGRGRFRRGWSLLVLASTLLVFYVALRFGLIAFSVNY